MSLLVVLPDAFWVELLQHWLFMKDVGRLDRAVCAREERAQYLRILTSDGLTLHGYIPPGDMLTTNVIRWVVGRSVLVDTILFDKTVPPQDVIRFSQKVGATLSCLHCKDVSSPLYAIGSVCRSLQFLHCANITDNKAIAAALFAAQNTIEQLQVVQCAKGDLSCLGDLHYPALKTLVATGSWGDTVLARVLACCPNLEVLGIEKQSLSVSLSIARTLPKVRQVQLKAISQSEVSALLTAFRTWTSLESVSLEDCPVSNELITSMLRSNRNLHSLRFSKCGNLSDNHLRIIAEECGTRLGCLDICECRNVTSAGLAHIFNQCVSLECLALRRVKFSASQMAKMLRSAAQLQWLDISGYEGVAKLCKQYRDSFAHVRHIGLSLSPTEPPGELVDAVKGLERLQSLRVDTAGSRYSAVLVALLRVVIPTVEISCAQDGDGYWEAFQRGVQGGTGAGGHASGPGMMCLGNANVHSSNLLGNNGSGSEDSSSSSDEDSDGSSDDDNSD